MLFTVAVTSAEVVASKQTENLSNKTKLLRTTLTISIAFSNVSVVQIVCVLHLFLQNLPRLLSQPHVRWQLVKLSDRCKGGFNMWTHAQNM